MRISDWSSDVCSSDLLLGERRDFGMNPRVRGRRRAHNAARVIAAGGDRVEQHLVQPLDGGADILLQHPMELEGLARRQTERVAAMRPRQLINLQPLLGRADAENGRASGRERVCQYE